MRAIPLLMILISCGGPRTTQESEIERENSIITIKARSVDTIRAIAGSTKSIPPQYLYRDVAYLHQIQMEIDLRLHERFPKQLTVAALTPDDSLSFHILNWNEAVEVSPTAATFTFLLKSTSRGKAYFMVVDPVTGVAARKLRSSGFTAIL